MCVLIDLTSKSGLKKRQQRRDCSMIPQRMSSLILISKILAPHRQEDIGSAVTLATLQQYALHKKSAAISAKKG